MTPDLERGIGGEEDIGGVKQVSVGLAAVVVDRQLLHAKRTIVGLVAIMLERRSMSQHKVLRDGIVWNLKSYHVWYLFLNYRKKYIMYLTHALSFY